MKSLIVIILITMLAGCLPQSQVRTAGVSSDDTTDAETPVSQSDVELSWYQNLASNTLLSLYRDSADNAYMRGRRIENFLLKQNAPTATYCLEVDIGSGIPVTDRRYLRLRAIPVSVNNIATGVKTIYLRIDFGNTTAGASACALDKVQYVDDSNTQYISYASTASNVSFTLASTCTSCVTQIVTNKFKLFTVDSANSRMVQVKPTELSLDILNFALQPGNSPTTGGTCSSSSCSALGYDCCLENQCVNDGAVRNSVQVTSNAFLSAEQEKLANPLAFLKYPQFYYICGTAQTDPGTGNGSGNQSDADAAAQARLLEMQKDYACIQLLKTNSTATPFHLAPYNASASYDQSICNTVTSSEKYYWQNVLSRLYTNCGCDAANTTLSQQMANCPKYDYQATAFNALSQPIQFSCNTLDESGTTTPFQNMNVAVNSRAIPHRYFNTAGVEIDPSKNPTGATNQEGLTFSYADPEKIQPANGSFNMNSVLGPLNVQLSGAIPATVVDIELDNVYLIATRSGYYTPCPSCAKDSWFASFSPNPSSGQGVGLQAVGHSTSRDAWDNNTTLGNYEDTIFGRACWVPPTMLPFSQPAAGSAASPASQRQARLKAQAAMWINGYQRDWYGFNKGALIGSFDGVSWFAVGKGRIVRSTTKKLFLAINAPFGDLAENNNHVVSVQAYEGQATAAQLDYHPEYSQNHPNQNEAGNCQAYHRCNVDSDCVTRLGWEYACADVSQIRTHWPSFDPVGAAERLQGSSDESRGIEGILAQGTLPSGSTKRCVYRGAGSVCRTDAGNIPDTELEKKKLLTCAPNFWCADVDSTNANIPNTGTVLGVFNSQVARFAAPLSEVPVSNNHTYGRDANFLGRPLDYVHNKNLTPVTNLTQISDSTIRGTINYNVSAMDPNANGKVGLCRPGKRLPSASDVASQWNPFNQHQSLDEFSRTDYTSQIGGCPSNYLSINKLASCPVIGDDGNYVHLSASFSTNFPSSTSWSRRSVEQNSCGLESLRTGTATSGAGITADTLQGNSPFKLIEGKPLNAALNVLPGITRDACLRKPGSVCHTDLDCSPNRMHAEQVQYFSDNYFGNTPNREYYEQYLVCGQAKPKPYLSDLDFGDYDMTQNRCCREVGKDITTYSAQQASGTNTDDVLTAAIDPLITGTVDPANPARYERFSNVRGIGVTYPILSAFDGRDASTGALQNRTYSGGLASANIPGNVLTPKQWTTLNQTNSKTCCGGGWVRKFSDGTTDWTKRNRFNVNVSNFRCLNYLSPLVDATDVTPWFPSPPYSPGQGRALVDAEFAKYCFDISGSTGNCAQVTIPQADSGSPQYGTVDNPGSCTTAEYINATSNPNSVPVQQRVHTLAGIVGWSANTFAFFPPTTADTDPATIMDFSNTATRRNIRLFIPSYMGNWQPNGAGSVVMDRFMSDGNRQTRICGTNFTTLPTGPTDPGVCPANGSNASNGCCYNYNATSRILTVSMHQTSVGTAGNFYDVANPETSGRYGVQITFLPPGIGDTSKPLAKKACSEIHYLDILGRLELAGIPQITHEKIVCNNNAEKLVPGIYKLPGSPNPDNNRSAFNSPAYAFNSSSKWQTNHHGLENGAVFSQQDFKCCTPAGKQTNDKATCCSGYGVDFEEDGTSNGRKTYTCKLPSGTNLSVYFNRFVSNEGMGDHLGVTPLAVGDFNEKTGEPLLTPTVNAKIVAIGREICESGSTRRGGAFGEFAPEPLSAASQGQTVFGIVDSSADNGSLSSGGGTSEVGYYAFMQGYRWNHQLYCE